LATSTYNDTMHLPFAALAPPTPDIFKLIGAVQLEKKVNDSFMYTVRYIMVTSLCCGTLLHNDIKVCNGKNA
jgi:hypothetical protein